LDRLATMRIFLQVVDCGSFAVAARTLDISRPMVTRAVAQLEARLHTRLLQRTSRRVFATASGCEFAARCREILAATDEAEANVGRAQMPSGVLRIAMTCALAIALAAPLVGAYCRLYPDVSIILTLTDRPVDLVAEGFDIAVVHENMLLSHDVVRHNASRCSFIACCTPGYLRASEPNLPRALREHRVLCIEGLSRRLSAAGYTRLHVSSSIAAIKPLLLEGVGIAILPAYAVAAELAEGTLVQVPHEERLPFVNVQVAYPSGQQVSAKVLTFVEMSLEHIGTFGAARADATA
jgi:DNA-binding transcriptional LysR family regulator